MAIQPELIDRLEQCKSPDEARGFLSAHKGEGGLSKAFFDRVAAHFTSNPSRAFALADLWSAVLDFGDDASYAYRAKGVSDRGRNDWLASARSFRRAGRLAKDRADKFSFQAGAVDGLARARRMDEAERLGAELADGLEKLGRHDLAARVLLNLGNALLLQDRMAEARKHLERAFIEFDLAKMPGETVSALLGLSTTHLYFGDPRMAAELAEETKKRAADADLPFVQLMAEMNLAHAHLLTARPDDALDRLLAVREHLAMSPTEQTRCIEFIGDAYYRLNLWPEALDAYQEAMNRTDSIQPNHEANVRLGIGLCLVAMEQPKKSLPYFSEAYRMYLKLKNLAWASASMLGKSKAYQAMGRKQSAQKSADLARDLSRQADSAFHWCEAVLAHDPSEDDLKRASKLIDKYGYIGLAWRSHQVHAQRTKGRAQTTHYRRMADSILESRLLTTSLISRASFLKDKSLALREYLSELLSKPTKANVAEALRIIVETRSVTLLDEIIAAQDEANSTVKQQLAAVRSELETLAAEEFIPTGSRRSVSMEAIPSQAQRRWVEIARNARAVIETLPPPPPGRALILTQAKENFYGIFDGTRKQLPCTVKDLEEKLRWLEYELLAPMVEPAACAEPAMRALKSLEDLLVVPWSKSGTVRIESLCPDGVLWRVPWQCVNMGGCPPDLLLHPSSRPAPDHAPLPNSRTLLWVSESGDLKHAGAEARSFLKHYPDARVCRTAKEALASLEDTYDLVHVVSHSRHRAENPMFSSIEFGDGPVFAADVARSGLRSRLVTLAACDTGAVSLISKEEPDGLARAFLSRGASYVIASAWALHDEAAARAFGVFYDCLSEGKSVRETLHQARCQVREWREHPYYWGALTLYRGYGI